MTISKSAYIAEGAVVVGDVTIGDDCGVWHNATIRGDINTIKIGKGSNIQDGAVVHVDKTAPVVIGDYVTVGHGAIIHGCIIENECTIGMGAIVMSGAVIGEGSIIGSGALVTQNKVIPPRSMAFGNPAKVVREINDQDYVISMENTMNYVEEARKMLERLSK